MKNRIKKLIQYFIPSFRPQVSNEEQRRLGMCINFRIPTHSNLVAITFDDGPSEGVNPEYLKSILANEVYDGNCTRKVLSVLNKHGAKATFFVCGEHINANGIETLRQTHAEGHEVAVHCWHHGESFHRIHQDELLDEVMKTKRLIQQITGDMPSCVRPPRGETESVTTQLLFSHAGLRTILWQETAFDWLFYTPEQSVNKILETIRPGSIVLMHDIYRYTPETVDLLLSELKKRGMNSTTVSELIKQSTDLPQYMPVPVRP